MPDPERPLPPVPEASVVVKRSRLSMVWIVPIAAAVVGGWVAVTTILGRGPEITIVFESAEGLEAGKTKVRHSGVDIGTVTSIRLAADHATVIATARLAPDTKAFLADDTKFWVVRPRISGANVSGLGTLISGAFIASEIGESTTLRHDFVALKVPPIGGGDTAGRYFVLKTGNLGSIDAGTPLFIRHLSAGEVEGYKLDADGKTLTVRVFVRAPFDRFVGADTRFWHASGIDVSFEASGLRVKSESLLSIMIGGIAFEPATSDAAAPEAAAETVFTLFDDRKAAFAPPPQHPNNYVLVFRQSVRGLAVGAPVEFLGIPVGEVTDVRAHCNVENAEFSVVVAIQLDAGKYGVELRGAVTGEARKQQVRLMSEALVERGLRARLKTANLLSGALLIALDIIPDAPPVTMDWTKSPVELPTAPGGFEAIESSLSRILMKLDALPVEAIGNDVKKAIADLDEVLVSARGTVDHVDDLVVNKLGKLPFQSIGEELRATIAEFDQTLISAHRAIDDVGAFIEPDSALAANLNATLQGVARAARDLGLLLDYLERHPEALIRGKSGEGN